MRGKPYSTEEQEPLMACEPEAVYRTLQQPSVHSANRVDRNLPEGCVSSEEFWNLFEKKMRMAYAEL